MNSADANPAGKTHDPAARGAATWAWRVIGAVVIAAGLAGLYAGFGLRDWVYAYSEPIRRPADFADVAAAMRALPPGDSYASVYAARARQQSALPPRDRQPAPAPITLAVQRAWAADIPGDDAQARRTAPTPAATAPLRRWLTWIELAIAALAFAIVRAWTWPAGLRLSRATAPRAAWTAITGPAAWVAAAMLWLNPALILSAHARGELWGLVVLPLLAAVLAGTFRRWTLAGFFAGVAVAANVDAVVVLPWFVLWPLLSGRKDNAPRAVVPGSSAAIRSLAGTAVALAAIAAPGVLRLDDAWHWSAISFAAGLALLAASAGALRLLGPKLTSRWWIGAAIAATTALILAGAVYWRINAAAGLTAAAVAATLVGVAAVLPWRTGLAAAALLAAASTLASPAAFGTSSAIYDALTADGRRARPELTDGVTRSLPTILQRHYGWKSAEWTVWQTPMRTLLGRVVAGGILAACVAGAIHARRQSGRVLLVPAAVFLVWYAAGSPMRADAIVYAVALGALAAGNSVGLTCTVAALSWVMFTVTIAPMLPGDGTFAAGLAENYGPRLARFINGTVPGIGWGVAVLAATWVVVLLSPSRDRPNVTGSK